jgi:hypothetical protein
MDEKKWRIVEFLVKLELMREEKYAREEKYVMDPERIKRLQEIKLFVQEQIIEEAL